MLEEISLLYFSHESDIHSFIHTVQSMKYFVIKQNVIKVKSE